MTGMDGCRTSDLFDDPALAKSISFVNNAKTTMIMSTSGQLLTDGI
jgi:hypothetical protein